MHSRDIQDILGGSALVLIGTFAAIYSLTSLRLGTVNAMGPGMFPAALACILVALGLLIIIPALFRKGEMPKADIRPFLTIVVGIFAFGIMVRPFGLIPSIFALTFVASLADKRLSLPRVLILAAALSVTTTVIFRVALGLQLPVIAWPW